jgi:uncharacterized SAM-binding protein YcdF (DUF218 family)
MSWLYSLKLLARTLILPPGGPLLLGVVGLLFLWRVPRLALTAIIIAVATLWLLATRPVGDALTLAVEGVPPLDLARPVDAQAVVILGGGHHRAAAPEFGNAPAADDGLMERLAYGALVAQQLHLPVLVTGYRSEAQAMRESLARHFGIQAHWVEQEALDTFENARHSVPLLKADGVRRIVLVTNATHMRRAVHEFMDAGIEVVPAPMDLWTPDDGPPPGWVPNAWDLMRSHDALYELLGESVRRVLSALHLRERLHTDHAG